MRYVIALLLITVFSGCDKQQPIEKILQNLKFSGTTILADGQSTIVITVEVADNSSMDRRNVIFSTSSGVFTGSGTKKYTVKAEYSNGVLIAKAILKAPVKPGSIKVSVQPEFDSPVQEYILEGTIDATASVPVSIKLEPSSFGIASNHLNEVFIVGKLSNGSGNFVSSDYKVLFEDLLVFVPANGQFRNMQPTVADSSLVSTYYSAFAHPIGTQIKIRGTLLDGNGQRTAIKDSIFSNHKPVNHGKKNTCSKEKNAGGC